ncbi:MAG: hypothetical protein KC492_33485, partial [Myxococcales bacterium]|nr:hypothetical protein [Myxococcales bacterium]
RGPRLDDHVHVVGADVRSMERPAPMLADFLDGPEDDTPLLRAELNRRLSQPDRRRRLPRGGGGGRHDTGGTVNGIHGTTGVPGQPGSVGVERDEVRKRGGDGVLHDHVIDAGLRGVACPHAFL